MEAWIWCHLPHWLAGVISDIHDAIPWTAGEWCADENGDLR